jgi:F0F1-type ATP synthase assembly protein I
MLASFFVGMIVITLIDRFFSNKPDELFMLVMCLLLAVATGLEFAVSVMKKELGLE